MLLTNLLLTLVFVSSTSATPLFATLPISGESGDKSTLTKRQAFLTAAREAIVGYHCPVSQEQLRTFIWRANVERATQHITMTNVRNIDAWGHLEVVTNDFATHWYARHSRVYAHHCCSYVFSGAVVGTIHDHRIDMTMAAVYGRGYPGMEVTEICIEAIPESECHGKTLALRGLVSHCEILGVAVYQA